MDAETFYMFQLPGENTLQLGVEEQWHKTKINLVPRLIC